MPINNLIANITLAAGVVCGTMYAIITILPLPYVNARTELLFPAYCGACYNCCSY